MTSLPTRLEGAAAGSREPTDAQIDSAIRAIEYKYFGDYEMSPEQMGAVQTLVAAAAELKRIRAHAEQKEG